MVNNSQRKNSSIVQKNQKKECRCNYLIKEDMLITVSTRNSIAVAGHSPYHIKHKLEVIQSAMILNTVYLSHSKQCNCSYKLAYALDNLWKW